MIKSILRKHYVRVRHYKYGVLRIYTLLKYRLGKPVQYLRFSVAVGVLFKVYLRMLSGVFIYYGIGSIAAFIAAYVHP